MKKLISLVVLALTGSLFSNPFAEYQKYAEKPSSETFSSSYQHYAKEAKDEENGSAKIAMAYLHISEMNRVIDELKNDDELAPPMKFQIANLLLELKRYEEAIEVYDKINKDMPEWSCPWRHKGEALMKNSQLSLAEQAILKAIEAREGHFDAWVMLAEVQMKMGKKKESLKSISKANEFINDTEEEHNEEVSFLDFKKIELKILKMNKKKKEWKVLANKLRKQFPENEELKNIKYK